MSIRWQHQSERATNHVSLVLQVVEDGYEFFAKRQLVTLFSAPNYCGEFDNAGAMMSVDETLMCSFQVGGSSHCRGASGQGRQRASSCFFITFRDVKSRRPRLGPGNARWHPGFWCLHRADTRHVHVFHSATCWTSCDLFRAQLNVSRLMLRIGIIRVKKRASADCKVVLTSAGGARLSLSLPCPAQKQWVATLLFSQLCR